MAAGSMRTRLRIALGLILLATSAATPAQTAPRPGGRQEDPTLRDIRATLGSVPGFLESYPRAALPGAWAQLKNFLINPDTELNPKIKDLIALAVASQIPSPLLLHFHRESARRNGATEAEIREAAALAASARQWGAWLTGIEAGNGFKADIRRMLTRIRRIPEAELKSDLGLRPGTARSAETSYGEMKKSFGFVPEFMKRLPPEQVSGAWESLKTLEFSPSTELRLEVRSLISLAVSAQIGCQPCVHWHSGALETRGAKGRAVSEALGVASLASHWGAMLNANPPSEPAFHAETRRMLGFLAKQGRQQAAESGAEAARTD